MHVDMQKYTYLYIDMHAHADIHRYTCICTWILKYNILYDKFIILFILIFISIIIVF